MKKIKVFLISGTLMVFGLILLWGGILNIAAGGTNIFSLLFFFMGMLLIIFGIMGYLILSVKKDGYGQIY